VTAGTFTGQVILTTGNDKVTIPVTATVGASVFDQVNALNFTKEYGGVNPLPQVVYLASTGATSLSINAVTANSSGGNWLQINPPAYGYGKPTPLALTVSVNPAATLAAGTYTGEVIVQAVAGSPSMVIPVTLNVRPAASAYFDDLPGAVTFFQATGGTAPPAQTFRIRNAGPSVLNWSATSSTGDGGAWIALSASSGTAPSNLTVTLKPANLPGKGLVGGNYNGQIILTTATGRQSIPVTVAVGANVFEPLKALSFAMPLDGADPSPQILNVASTGTNFTFLGATANAFGGSWLQITPASYGYGTSTPEAVTVSVNSATPLAAGSYFGQVMFTSVALDQEMVVPVTLTVTGTSSTALPHFSPPGGDYTSTQSVVLSSTTRGSAIYYTLNGTTPTTASKQYSGPILVTATETIKAIATAPGFGQSAEATATYTITAPKAATPAASQTVTISEATAGATVYYTTNGSIPTTASTKYTVPLVFTTTTTLKFIAVAPDYSQSLVRTVTITVQ
jgi:hypothetical protein